MTKLLKSLILIGLVSIALATTTPVKVYSITFDETTAYDTHFTVTAATAMTVGGNVGLLAGNQAFKQTPTAATTTTPITAVTYTPSTAAAVNDGFSFLFRVTPGSVPTWASGKNNYIFAQAWGSATANNLFFFTQTAATTYGIGIAQDTIANVAVGATYTAVPYGAAGTPASASIASLFDGYWHSVYIEGTTEITGSTTATAQSNLYIDARTDGDAIANAKYTWSAPAQTGQTTCLSTAVNCMSIGGQKNPLKFFSFSSVTGGLPYVVDEITYYTNGGAVAAISDIASIWETAFRGATSGNPSLRIGAQGAYGSTTPTFSGKALVPGLGPSADCTPLGTYATAVTAFPTGVTGYSMDADTLGCYCWPSVPATSSMPPLAVVKIPKAFGANYVAAGSASTVAVTAWTSDQCYPAKGCNIPATNSVANTFVTPATTAPTSAAWAAASTTPISLYTCSACINTFGGNTPAAATNMTRLASTATPWPCVCAPGFKESSAGTAPTAPANGATGYFECVEDVANPNAMCVAGAMSGTTVTMQNCTSCPFADQKAMPQCTMSGECIPTTTPTTAQWTAIATAPIAGKWSNFGGACWVT